MTTTLLRPHGHQFRRKHLRWSLVGAVLLFAACEPAPDKALLAPSDADFATVQADCSGSDVTACVQNAINAAGTNGTVLFARGTTYTFNNSARLFLLEGTELRATGSGARPVLRFEQEHEFGSIRLESGTKVVSLDIRGPFENSTAARAIVIPDTTDPETLVCSDGGSYCPEAYGLNGAGEENWLVEDTHVNGFRDNGIHMCISTNGTVHNSNISYNGRTGVAAYCSGSSGYVVTSSVIRHNGQDGIDSSGDDALYQGNTLEFNGWQGHVGDQNGILIIQGNNVRVLDNTCSNNYSDGIVVKGVGHRILDNECNGNQRSGIRLHELAETLVGRNASSDNAIYGVEFDPGAFTQVGVCQTSGSGNSSGLLQTPPSGVTVAASCQPQPTIHGPTQVQQHQACSWTAGVSGFAPYSYEWRRDGQLVGTSSVYETFDTGSDSFSLDVIVSDRFGSIGGTDIGVTVSGWGGFLCEG